MQDTLISSLMEMFASDKVEKQLFRLILATGIGKTYSSAIFSLNHLKDKNKLIVFCTSTNNLVNEQYNQLVNISGDKENVDENICFLRSKNSMYNFIISQQNNNDCMDVIKKMEECINDEHFKAKFKKQIENIGKAFESLKTKINLKK